MLSSILFISSSLAAQTIDQVVVYSDRAEIQRTNKMSCTDGVAIIPFTELPLSIDPKTLRAEGHANVNIIGVTHEKKILDTETNQRVEKRLTEQGRLLKELQKQNNHRLTLQASLSQNSNYESYFMTIFQEELRAPKPNTAIWQKTLDDLRKKKQDIHKEMNDTDQKLKQLNRELSLIQKQLYRLNIQPNRTVIDAKVRVDCKAQPSAEVSLFYIVPGATWTPEYDLAFESKNGRSQKTTLTVSAKIRQSTGEDWNNAQLVLSTAKPNLGSEAPLPNPIWVNGGPSNEQKVMVQGVEDRSSLSNASGVHQQVNSAALEDGGLSFQLVLPHRTTINSDGHEYWVPVDQKTTDGVGSWVSIPRGSPHVYQAVTLSNPAPYPILAGHLNIQKNGLFVGNHRVDYTAPGEKMEISLGSTPKIDIKREVVYDKRTNQLIGKKQRLQRAYQITVYNNSENKESIEIREAIPISKTSDIKVLINKDATTGTYRFDEEQGFIIWTATLKGKETQKINLVYQIELPESWQVR